MSPRHTELAFLSQKALHHLAPNTEYLLGVVVEDRAVLPAKLNTPEACDQWFLLWTAIDEGCDRASAIDYAAFLGFFSAGPS